MDKFDYYIKVLKNYSTFTGRARRSEYWYFVLFNFLIALVLSFIDSAFDQEIFGSIYSLAILLPAIAVAIRRMHDLGKSGWFILIPFYNFYLAIQDSEPGSNQYGQNPKNNELDLEDNFIQ